MASAVLSKEERFRGGVGDESSVTRHKWQKQSCNLTAKGHKIECSGLSAAALSQIVGQAKSTAVARQMQPELIEGLDRALANIDPTKVTSQLILKAFEHAPGLVAQLQQVLDRNTDASTSILAHGIQQPVDTVVTGSCPHIKNGLSPGDYLVLQSPILQSAVLSDDAAFKQAMKSSSPKQSSRTHTKIASTAKAADEVSNGAMDSSKVRKDSSSVTSCSSEDTSDCDFVWDVSPSVLTAEVQALRKHKDWADKKIDLLIRRVREAEGPQRSLKEEVRQLRLEKNSVELKLKAFENSLQKLRECTQTEASQRREFELDLKNAQAELRGAHLREQEVQNQLQETQQALRQEKKKREAAERRARRCADESAETQATVDEGALALEASAKELELANSIVKAQKEQLEIGQAALLKAQQETSVAQQWGQDMESQVSITHAAAAARQEELEGVISALNQQLDLLSHQPQVSLYSHFNGPALFGGGMQWLQDPSFAVQLNDLGSGSANSEPGADDARRAPPNNFQGHFPLGQHARHQPDKRTEVE